MKNKKSLAKYPVLFSLYIAQSVPMSFFSTVVPVIMRQEKYSLQSIGFLQLIKLPWILKFLWAPLVDNYTRSARQIRNWIIFSELFYALVIISIALFNLQTDFKLIVILIIAAFIASATQDIATDIFAIQILKKNERAMGNSMQSAGSFAGSLLGTGVLLLAYHYFGWSNLLLLLAAFTVFAIAPLLLYKPQLEISGKTKPVSVKDIFLFFADKHNLHRLLILVFYYSGLIGILTMLKPYLVDLGYSIKQIGFMSGIIGTSTAVIAAFTSGYIIRLIGRSRAIYLFAIINLITAGFFYFISLHQPSLFELYSGICLLWGAYGLSTVIIYTTSMDAVRKNREGTDFTIQIVITHLSSIGIAVFSGTIGHKFGYTGLFATEILFCIICIILLFYCYPVKMLRNETSMIKIIIKHTRQ